MQGFFNSLYESWCVYFYFIFCNIAHFSLHFCNLSDLISPPSLLFLLCSFHNLGTAAAALQQDFYTIDKLCEGITGSVFSSLDHLTDHRLRPIIHILFSTVLESLAFSIFLSVFAKCTFCLCSLFSDSYRLVLFKIKIFFYVNWFALTSVHDCFWSRLWAPVLQSYMTVYYALCWVLCSPTCCRSVPVWFYFVFAQPHWSGLPPSNSKWLSVIQIQGIWRKIFKTIWEDSGTLNTGLLLKRWSWSVHASVLVSMSPCSAFSV